MRKNKIIVNNDISEKFVFYKYLIYRSTNIHEISNINIGRDIPHITAISQSQSDCIIDGEPTITSIQSVDTAHGLAKPEVSYDIKGSDIEFSIKENEGLTYYYAIAITHRRQLISPVRITSAHLKQNPEDIKYKISTAYKEYIKDTPDFSIKLNAFTSDVVPVFASNLITTNLSVSNKEVVINIPNIWYDINGIYNYREYNDITVSAVLDSYASEPAYIKIPGKAYTPVDKMVILQKEYDGNNEPLTEDVADTNNIIVREGGIYFIPQYAGLPVNVVNSPVSVFNRRSNSKDIAMKYKVENGKTYKYTIYLYDCFGKQSLPIVFNITV